MAERMLQVKVEGVRELDTAFRRFKGNAAGPAFRAALLKIATVVADKARGTTPQVSGTAAGSIQPHSSGRGASITFGGNAAPYMPWLDFGGSVGRGHVSGQAWSGSVRRDWMGRPVGEGRYVYPAISSEREATFAAVEAAVADAAREAGF